MIEGFINSPQYKLNANVLRSIARAERAQGIIDASPLLPIRERELRHEALIATIHASTHIEGNILGLGAVERILAGETVTARQRDVQEIVNYRHVLDYVEKVYRDTRHPFNDVMVREFHRVLMRGLLSEEQLGEYRSVQNYIVDTRTGRTIYTPPPVKEVPRLMLKLTDWINNVKPESCHPIIKAALTHYIMEAIHPFVDGNGRVGRVVSMFLLYRDGYDTRRLFSLEEYYDRNAKVYYESLQSVLRSRGDATFWVEYFAQGFAEQIEEVAEKIRQYLQGEKDRAKFARHELNKRQYEAVRWMQNRGTVIAADYAEQFNVSKRTANYDLSDLVGKGLVKQEGESRASKFKLA